VVGNPLARPLFFQSPASMRGSSCVPFFEFS
jgi:hypothetical protein